MRKSLLFLLLCLLLIGCKTITEIDPITGRETETIIVDPELTESGSGVLRLISTVTGTWIPELVLLGTTILTLVGNVKLKKGARATATAVERLKASDPETAKILLTDLKANERSAGGLLKPTMPDKV